MDLSNYDQGEAFRCLTLKENRADTLKKNLMYAGLKFNNKEAFKEAEEQLAPLLNLDNVEVSQLAIFRYDGIDYAVDKHTFEEVKEHAENGGTVVLYKKECKTQRSLACGMQATSDEGKCY